jgi:hypothetical protein
LLATKVTWVEEIKEGKMLKANFLHSILFSTSQAWILQVMLQTKQEALWRNPI